MDPGQHDVRCHWAERHRVVPDAGDVLVGGPVVGDQLGLRGYGAEHKSVDLLLAKALDHLQRARRGLPPSISIAPATSILPTALRPAGATIGSFLVRNRMSVSSASTMPRSGSRSGLTMARRSFAHNIQAVRYEPRPSWLCSCSAEMPLEC